MFLPNDSLLFCIKSLIGITITVGACYGMAELLTLFKVASLTSVGVISATLGLYLYGVTVKKASHDQPTKMSSSVSVPFKCSPLFGFFAIFLLGTSWHTMAVYGAGKIQPLPRECSKYIHEGIWVPIEPCTNDIRGKAERSQYINDISCSKTNLFTWGWKRENSNTLCRFVYRNPKSLSKALAHRNIVFVGDSMVRNLYHATLRSMGMPYRDYFDTTLPKHTDYSDKVGSTNFSFKWAPFTGDQADALNMIGSLNPPPDLVVSGGGTWDRLHTFDNDPTHTDLKKKVKNLVQQMNSFSSKGIPVVWTIPTIINDKGLQDDSKRQHMKDDQLDEFRKMQDIMGVHKAATFVLDGRSFSKDRVGESYDGVHYPPAVYDGGIQILANALDWILPPLRVQIPRPPPNEPGKMADPWLGAGILFISFIGLFLFDGFMGFSLLAGFFAKNCWTCMLYEEAFAPLHAKMKLPPIRTSAATSDNSTTEMVGFISKSSGFEKA